MNLLIALQDLNIMNKCHGFVIDGDMATKMADYFNKEHPARLPFGKMKSETLLT
jgi:hypothetical protein